MIKNLRTLRSGQSIGKFCLAGSDPEVSRPPLSRRSAPYGVRLVAEQFQALPIFEPGSTL
jgi:hypothetical protein